MLWKCCCITDKRTVECHKSGVSKISIHPLKNSVHLYAFHIPIDKEHCVLKQSLDVASKYMYILSIVIEDEHEYENTGGE